MNRIFKVVWSKSRQAYIVVSEYAKSRGGKTKIVAAVLAVIMGTAVQAPVWAANDRATLDPATQKIVDEVMKQVEANYVKKGTGNGTAVDNDMVKPGENPVKANAEQYGAVAIGRNAHAVQYRTVAIGAGAYANIDGGIAILGNTLQNDGISFGRDSYARGIAGIAIGRDTQSGVNSITIGRMARAAYSRPGNIGNPGAKVTHPLGGDDTNNPVFNKNAVAIGTNSLAGASNIVFLTPGTENTYLDFASTANIWASRVYSRAQMTKIKDGTKKHISDRFYGEGDINTAASDDKKVNFYDVVRDSGTDQVAVGHHSRALGDQAIAIGSNSIAGRYSIVMGGNTFGDGKQNDSFYAMYLNNDGIFRKLSGYRKVDNNPGNPNEGSTYAGEAGVAIGTKAHVLTQMGTAVGALARIEQDSFGAVALGAGASVGTQKAGHDSIGAVAIGMGSAAKGNGTVVLGARASAWPDSGDAHRITAVGYGTIAKNADSVALGSLAEADRGSDMAGYFYGYKAATIDQSKEAGSIQLKLKDGAADLIENYEVKVTPSAWEVPKATETDIENGIRTHVYAGLKGPAFKANAGALSIGKNGSTPDATDAITRQIVNVAAGTNDTDAVNVAQLRNVNMMVEADSAGAGTPKAFSDFLLDNARLKISGQSYLSTELTQDKEGPRITLKAKTTELIANPDGSFSTKNHEDGLITAGELVKRMNAAKKERDELEKKIGELVYLNAKGEKLQQKGGKFFKVNPDGSLDESKEEKPAAITSKRQGLQLANVNGAVTQLTPDGLADLSNISEKTGVNVNDISKIGWILSVPDDKYSEAVVHNRKVSFFGKDLAKVTAAGKGEEPRMITVTVDRKETGKAVEQEFLNNGFTQIRYVDANNKPLVRAQDGKYYYPVSDKDNTPDTSKPSVEPAARVADVESHPTVLSNVKHGADVINKTGDPTDGLADLSKAGQRSNVATVEDLHNLGFVIKGKADDDSVVTGQVKHANTVEFAGEDLAKVITESKDGKHKVTVKVNKDDVTQAVNAANAHKGTAPTAYVDKDGNPLVKGDDGNYHKVKDDGTLDNDTTDPAGVRLGEKDTPMQLTNVKPGTNEITAEGPTKGLADLEHAVPGTVATVDDLKKMGFVVADGANYHATVANAQTVKFVGEGLATVTGETKDNIRTFTVKVDKDEVAKAINADSAKKGAVPTTYVDKDGNPLVKAKDGKYYPKDKVGDDGTPQTGAQAVDSPVIQVGEKGKPIQLTNVKPGTNEITAEGPTKGLADLEHAVPGTVATVDDLQKLGFVIKGKAADGTTDVVAQVKHANTVEFAGEDLAKVVTESKDGVSKVTVKVSKEDIAKAVNAENAKKGSEPTTYVDKDGNPLVKGSDGKYYKPKADGTLDTDGGAVDPAGVRLGEKDKPIQLTNVAPATKAIDKENDPTNGLADLANAKSGTVATVDDLKRVGFVVADGGNYHATVTNAQTVKFVGEGLAEVSGKTENDVRTFTVKVDDKKVADAVKSINDKAGNAPTQYVDKDGNPLVKAKDGNYYPKDKVGDDGQPIQGAQAVEPAGIQVGEKGKPTQLTNVAPATEAINKANDPTNGLADLANAKDGTVATVADLKKLGFVIKGKAEDGTTDVVAQVKHADTVEFAGEDLAKVITESANGVSKVTVKVNKEEIAKAVNAENAKKGSEPTTYVDENGDPLVKGDDGKYYKPKADGTPDTDAGEKTPAGIRLGEKDKPIQLDNVARGTETKPVNGKDGQPIMGSDNQPLQLVDLKDAKDTKVATVGDLKDMGFVLGASVNAAGGNKAYQDVVKNGNKVKFVGLGGAWISGKTAADGTRIITIDVNADNLVTGTQNAIQYVDGKGNRMIPMLQKGNEVLYYNAADNPVKHKMPNSDEEAVYRMSDIVEGTGTLKPDAQPLQGKKAADVPNLGVALVHPNGSADTTEGTVLRNVGVGTATIAAPTDDKDIVGKAKAGLADLANSKDTNGLSVADAKKLGFVIKGKAADGTTDVTGQVKHANTVEFAGEDLAKVITESANGVSKVTVKVNKEDIVKVVNDANDKKGSAPTQYVDKDGNPLVKAKDGKYYPKDKVGDDGTPQTGAQAVDPVGIQVGEKDKPTQLMNIAPGTTSIATPTDPNASQADKAKAGLADLSIPTDAASDNVSKHTAATVDDLRRMGWILSVGDTYADKVQNAQEVNFKGAGLAEVSGQTEGQKRVITVTVDEQKVAAAVKAINDKAGNAPIHYVDQEGNPLVKAKDNKYYPTDKVDNEGNVIAGAKDAVPVVQIGEKGHPMQLTNVAAGTSEIKEGPTKGLADLEHAASGTVATVDDLQKLGFVIKGTDENGKAVSGQVRHANTVEFAGDGLAKVITESKDGVSKVTVKVNKEEIAKAVNAENAKNGSAPTKYVDKDGNSLVKGENGKYYKAKDDGTPDTAAGEKMPAGVQIGEKDKPITVTNVKSNFDAVAPDAKEAKAPESKKNPDGSVDPTAANPLVAMQHNAATIADIMNSPWNLQVNGKAVKAVKAFDTVNITDGTNTKVVATETGYKVNVVGLPTAYTDNAGNTIAKGTDGKWFVTDKDGNMTATPADLGQDGKGTPSVSLVNPAAEPGKAGEPVVMHNVGQGNLPTDAVNKDQMDTAIAGMAKAIGNTKDEAHGIGADAAALAALKPLQYDPVEPTQIMAGIGNYQQKTAVALGVAHYTNESTMLNAGVSLGTGHTMVNVGYTRKFGHTKDEKEIPDRYKAGPISSIYVMQDEVSALKAENEQQKREIQELREMVLAMAANKK